MCYSEGQAEHVLAEYSEQSMTQQGTGMAASRACLCPFICVQRCCDASLLAVHFWPEAILFPVGRMAPPFTMRRDRVVVEGGGMAHPWVVDTKLVDGREFVALDKADRKLARAMGRDMKSRTPWHRNEVLAYIAKLRDDAVDAIISKDRHASDPMADEADEVPTVRIQKGRGKAMMSGSVPDIIDVTYPAFLQTDGTRHPPVVISVLSAPRRGAVASMELTPSNLDLLLAAAGACEHESPMPCEGEPAESLADKVELEMPNCKWRRRGSKCSIYCRYRAADGEWRFHSEAPPVCADPDAQVALVREVERRVQQFHEEHHTGDSQETEAC
jgi:hypothetical protein